MKKALIFVCILVAAMLHNVCSYAEAPDTVKTGIYITSVHNIDFKQKEYAISLWMWLRYHKREFDFLQNLEIPQAKSVTKSFSTMDSSGGDYYLLMKLDCVMKDSWRINNFPFDHQKLRFSVENSQFDSKALVFMADTMGRHIDPKYALRGWRVDSLRIVTDVKVYETAFGDKNITTPHSEYSTYKATIEIERDAMGLFWKMFLGMYIAFLIAYICFYIHSDGMDSRFGLSVGSLFAVVGNKYIVDSALPESTSFTLVDALHGLTLFSIFAVIACTAISLLMVKKNKIAQAKRFDMIAAQTLLVIYIVVNIILISKAADT